MQELLLEVKKREVVGKAVKRLREQGLVPAVIHDHGQASVHVMGEYLEMAKIYHAAGKHHPINLKAEGKQYIALIKSVDFDPKKHQMPYRLLTTPLVVTPTTQPMTPPKAKRVLSQPPKASPQLLKTKKTSLRSSLTLGTRPIDVTTVGRRFLFV